MAPLKLAVIGTNWITNSFVQSAHESKLFTLTAVYSRSLDTANKFITETPSIANPASVQAYNDLAALLASPAVDVVYIASPNSLHHAQGLQALHAGKHVIMEKPFASNTAQFTELFALADAKGLFLLEAYRHIQEPNFHALQQQLAARKFGRVFGASVNMAVYSSRAALVLDGTGEEPNVLSPKFSGGSLWDMGCYPVMFTLALFGRPAAQRYFPVMLSTGVDGGGPMVLEYAAQEGGEKFTVMAHTSKIYTSTAPTEIYCERGTVRVRGATGVTDIDSIEFVPRGKTEGEQLGETKPEFTGMLNLTWEAKELGRILVEGDREAEKKLRSLSRDVLEVMEDMRKQNGIVFACEQ